MAFNLTATQERVNNFARDWANSSIVIQDGATVIATVPITSWTVTTSGDTVTATSNTLPTTAISNIGTVDTVKLVKGSKEYNITSSTTLNGSNYQSGSSVSVAPITVSAIANQVQSSGGITLSTEEEAQKFLSMAGFGGTKAEIDALVGTSAESWLQAQFALPNSSYITRIKDAGLYNPTGANFEANATGWEHHIDMFLDDAIVAADDILRKKTIFALSQIVVASEQSDQKAHREAYYVDVLSNNAFGNWRQLLEDITYTPLMSRYLTYASNPKEDPATGAKPDENYAREILQLFSIGLEMLNMDGTLELVNGQPVETYSNEDISQLARVFTGFGIDSANYPNTNGWYHPMVVNPTTHETNSSTFLGFTTTQGADGATHLTETLDHIFAHQNVAPFISRALIQRFTASHPSNAYIGRVATAFENGTFTSGGVTFGDGNKGNMQATLAAILLEPTLYDANNTDATSLGKIREPLLKWIHVCKALEMENVDSASLSRIRFDLWNDEVGLAQEPFNPPSVFNFYPPDYVAPSTQSGALGYTAPELALLNATTTISYLNWMSDFITDRSTGNLSGGVTPYDANKTRLVALADNSQNLVDDLALLLTGNRISTSSKTDILNAVDSIAIQVGSEDADRLARVNVATIMFIADPSFTVVY